MMIRNSKEKVPQAKKEAGLDRQTVAAGAAETGSRSWAGLRDPRIVRVARSLGGKDRHSKVSTIRGLRDRRVRLSVPTAIQLYDLQDRLGLNQPSKVVDWLLDAAQHEIDKLPPLQIPPGCFLQYPQSMGASHGVVPLDEEAPSGPPMAASLEYRTRRRDPTRGAMEDKDGLTFFRRIEPEQPVAEAHTTGFPFHGDLHRQSHASMAAAGLPASGSGEYSTGYHMETSNLCVSHLGCHPLSQGEELHVFRQPATSPPPPPMFSPYAAAAAAAAASGYEHKNSSSFQMGSSALHGFMLGSLNSSFLGSSASVHMRPLQVSIASSNHHHSQNHHESSTTAE